jgi:hypothetical protein
MSQEWYYAQNNQKRGPVSAGQLKQLADSGQLRPSDLVWKQGLPNWVAASSLKGLFAAVPAPPPSPAAPDEIPADAIQMVESGPPGVPGPPPGEVLMLHLSRAVGRDLQAMPVSADEREQLAALGVADETTQRYLIWRCSLLFLVIVPTFLSAVLETVSVAERGFQHLSTFGSLMTGMLILTSYSLPVTALVAALLGRRQCLSRRVVQYGWAAGFLFPVLVALFPPEWLLDLGKGSSVNLLAVGFLFGVLYNIQLMPTVLSLLSGMLRGCLRIKSLLPESILPGWFLVAGAPLYAFLLLVTFITIMPMFGNALLLLSVILLLLAPLPYVAWASRFTRPLTSHAERQIIGQVQWGVFGIAGMGVLFLLIFLLTKKLGAAYVGFDEESVRLVGFSERTSLIRPWEVLQFFLEYYGRSLFTTVLAADLLLRANLSAWRTLGEFAKTEESLEYDKRMGQLDQVTRSM